MYVLFCMFQLPKSRDEVTKKMIDGIETPYFEIVMDGGTPCPLKAGQNRKTRVQYICNAQAFHNEILRCDFKMFPNLQTTTIQKPQPLELPKGIVSKWLDGCFPG